jgi:outer membrane protein TolC
MSRHFWRGLAMAAAWLPGLAAAAPLKLEQALELAVQRSHATRSARAAASSAGETARAAAQLPDPMLSVGVENLPVTGPDRFDSTRDFQTMKRIGISQEWVSAEKRSARAAAARAMGERERVAERAAAAEARLQTALAYVDAWYAGEALKLATLDEHHAHEALEVGKGRLATSAGSSAEVLALAASLGMAEDASAEVRQRQSLAAVALQRWVGIAADELGAPALDALPSEAAFVSGHPVVALKQREIEVARQDAAATATNRKPNWTWAVSYGQRTGFSDMLSVGVSIPLTVAPAERQDRETAAKLARVDQAEAELAEAQRVAQAEHAAWAGEARHLQERLERLRAALLVPAVQRTAAATAAYRSNQGSLAMLFEARHAEVDAQRKLLDLQRDLARTQAQMAYRPLAIGNAP